MKQTLTATVLALLLGFLLVTVPTSGSHARTPNFVDQSDSFLSYSIGYEYTIGQYEPVSNTTDDDTSFETNMTTVQLSVRPTYYTQFYGIVGLEKNAFEDTTTERGTVTGAGAQIILDDSKDLYLKAIGSFYKHEELDVSGQNASIKFTQDWQGGFLLGRSVRENTFGNLTSYYNAYMGVLYSDRRAELTKGGSTTELEQARANGGSLFAGVNWKYSPAVRLKFEGEVGAMTSGAFRLTYTF